MFVLIRRINAVSLKITTAPVLAVSIFVLCALTLRCCAPEPETVYAGAKSPNERSVVLEQDEICQFAQQLIIESGLTEDVLLKFKNGEVMLSDESKGVLLKADAQQCQKICEIESDGLRKVWHIIDGVYRFPQGDRRVITYLLARKDSTSLRKAGECLLSHDYSWFCDTQQGSYGDAILKHNGSGLHRIA